MCVRICRHMCRQNVRVCVCAAVSNSALTAVGQSQPGCDLSVYLSTFNLSFCFTLFLLFQNFFYLQPVWFGSPSVALCILPSPALCWIFVLSSAASCLHPTPKCPLDHSLCTFTKNVFMLFPYLEFSLVHSLNKLFSDLVWNL